MTFKLFAPSFRAALAAVEVHAFKNEKLPDLGLVMFNMTEAEELLLTASNGFTIGVATCAVTAWDGELSTFAVHYTDVAGLLKVFGGTEVEELAVELLDGHGAGPKLRVTDVGGLMAGKSLTVRAVTQHGRDVAGLWHSIAVRMRDLRQVPPRTAVTSGHMKLFNAAATVYKEPLVIQMGDAQGTLLVQCGESFLGIVPPTDISQVETEYQKFRDQWKKRLPMKIQAVRDGS